MRRSEDANEAFRQVQRTWSWRSESLEHDNRGGIRYLMTNKALDNLRRVVGNSQKVEALAGVYAVVSATDSTIITVAHRH